MGRLELPTPLMLQWPSLFWGVNRVERRKKLSQYSQRVLSNTRRHSRPRSMQSPRPYPPRPSSILTRSSGRRGPRSSSALRAPSDIPNGPAGRPARLPTQGTRCISATGVECCAIDGKLSLHPPFQTSSSWRMTSHRPCHE
ncbi:hypothetical protein EDB85DRAFT_2291730 [Lactarius pseudohatsudake]|nr:hypothetical protein EDB85DRAFT_2291730 [Lactarius pseudohatsudake]